MANVIKLKRRATGGAAGAPASLKTSEPAYNEVDDVLYYGKGDDGAGNATSIIPISGKGAYVDLSSTQTIAGAKAFSSSPTAPTPASNDNTTKVATTEFVQTALSSAGVGAMKYQGVWNANTNSPSLSSATGTQGHFYKVSVAGSTVLDGIGEWKVGDWVAYNGTAWDKVDNTDQVSSVNGQTGVVSLTKSDVGLSNVPNTDATSRANHSGTQTASTISDFATAVGNTAALKGNNLSDLTNSTTARSNLGLGTMATQNANAVAITGGTIDGVALDGGTF